MTITFGHVLTLLGAMVGAFLWGHRDLSNRIGRMDTRITERLDSIHGDIQKINSRIDNIVL